jgi:excisionase family DNA binding protein
MSGPVIVKPLKSSNTRGRKRLRDVSAILQGPLPVDVEIVFGDQHFVLPPEILAVMRAGTEVLLADASVVIAGQEATLTSQQAADMLNVSRPHLLKMARGGALPHVMAGTHHRFPLSAVQEYAAALRRDRAEALREIAPVGGYQDGDF